MVRMMILADDFTGALDTGVMFSIKNIATKVYKNTEFDRNTLDTKADVIVINTNSRSVEPDIAYKRTREMVDLAKELKVEYIFKKIDSGFRGNIGKELKGVIDGFAHMPVHLIPAYPDMGRVVIDGTSYIDGKLLEYSVFASDPFDPVKKSFIPDIINEEISVQVEIISKHDFSNGKNQPVIKVYDSEFNEEIDEIVSKVINLEGVKVFSGCAALAKSLAKQLDFEKDKAFSIEHSEGVYISCGSLNDITKAQVSKAQQCGYTRFSLNYQQKIDSEYFSKEKGKQFLKVMLSEAEKSHKVVVDSFNTRTDENYDRNVISINHSIIAKTFMEANENYTYLFTGGETLKAFMDYIQCDDIQIIGEIEEGVVVSRIQYRGKKHQIISKSGGFGSEHVFCKVANRLMKKGN